MSTESTTCVPDDDAESPASLREDPNTLSFRYHPDLLDASWGSYLHSAAGDRGPKKVVINDSASLDGVGASQQQPPPPAIHLSDSKAPKGILRTAETKEEPPAGKLQVEPRPLTKSLNALEAAFQVARDNSASLGMDAVADILSNSCDLLAKARLERGSAQQGDTPRNALHVVTVCLEKLLEGTVESYRRMKAQEEKLEDLEEELCRKQVHFLKEQEDVERSLAKGAEGQGPPPHPPPPIAPKVPAFKTGTSGATGGWALRDPPPPIPPLKSKTLPYTTAHGISQLKPLVKPQGALLSTHTQQWKLERALFSQQKDIDNLDRSHNQTKKDLVSAQQRIARLQKQLRDMSTEASKVTAPFTKPSKDNNKGQSEMVTGEGLQRYVPKLGLKKALQTQSRLAQQKAEANGRQEPHNPKLPVLHRPLPHQPETQQNPPQSLVLPPISQHHGDARDPHYPPSEPPHYSFTTEELFSLASFNDPITAAQVIQWLRKQGRLKDQPHT